LSCQWSKTVCDNRRLLVILGPTATGKSQLAIELARRIPAEIISGDSMLVYRGFNIGTAKPPADELREVPHHLLDILEPTAKYSAADFQRDANALIKEVNERGKIPVLVGGTGLYIQSLLEGYKFNAARPNEAYRRELNRLVADFGADALYERLSEIDPTAAAKVDRRNPRRLIRALETAAAGESGGTGGGKLIFDAQVIGLNTRREVLYQRIETRVDQMIAAGLVDEVKKLLADGVPPTAQAMQGIGYKEFYPYLQGRVTLAEATAQIKQNTRRFAKRQMTWFRRMPYIEWLDCAAPTSELADKVSVLIRQKYNWTF